MYCEDNIDNPDFVCWTGVLQNHDPNHSDQHRRERSVKGMKP